MLGGMQAAQAMPPDVPGVVDDDVRLIVHGVSWGRYVLIRELLDDQPGLRMTYLEGTLEIMSPSREHERAKVMIARLIEAWALVRRVRLNGYGSTTLRKEARERGLEPDECYVLGELREVPDIAIEVVLTSGGIDKLAVYRGLGVPEVWFYRQGAFTLHALEGDRYVAIERSRIVPALDLEQLARFVDASDQTAAVRAYVDALGVLA
jgi:Uma2 family endonuclease